MTEPSEFRREQSSLTPPQEIRIQLEQQVMRGIDELPAKRRRKRLALTLGSGALAVLLFIVFSPQRTQVAVVNTDYVESVVILDDHVCIWLEPAAAKPGAQHD